MDWAISNWLNDNRDSMRKREERLEAREALLRERLWRCEKILNELDFLFSVLGQVSRETYEQICEVASE